MLSVESSSSQPQSSPRHLRVIRQEDDPSLTQCQPDVIVVGAGVAGSALAYALGQQGRHVLLCERDWRKPDRIVGELLQPAGVDALKQLGMLDTVDGIDGIDCFGYVVFSAENGHVQLPYPLQEGAMPGRSFHHGNFIEKLRQKALSCHKVHGVECTVADLLSCPKSKRIMGVSCSFKSGNTRKFFAPYTFIVDGCFSKFRKQVITKPIQVSSHFVGLVLEDCPLPFPNHGHVILAKPSPILLYQIGTRDTRILIDVPGKLPSSTNGDLTRYMTDVIAPQLPTDIIPVFLAAIQNQRMRSMPNSWLPPTSNSLSGATLLGDAMNMRHPLTGGGMTVALWDVVHLTTLLAPTLVPNLAHTQTVDEQVAQLHWKRKSLSSVINVLAQALYSVFSANDNGYMRIIQDACFKYFELGGNCKKVPISLLSGLTRSRPTLVYHFFCVALYGIWLLWRSEPVHKFPLTLMTSCMVLYTAAMTIGPVFLSELGK